ncbi:cytosolic phospholipase A2-like isoform X3 [Mytilus californianus]|uniref:cytosolic phospholipase A2-like isoform X3 n=1 Tax=Mytilus californianus TaxID=6549 RepID=UPI002246D56F|nr:cytosolic phospholipase A2-like isoform X3 [Mytilus californianus]
MAQRSFSTSTCQDRPPRRRSLSINFSSCKQRGKDEYHTKSKSCSTEPNMIQQKQSFRPNRKSSRTLSDLRTFDNNEGFLCEKEQEFQEKRKLYIHTALQKLLNTVLKADDVPHIALMGSGGGYRAMVAMSGIINALYNSKILDCILYTAVLSGSSWFITTLYSHPEWPNIDPKYIQKQLKTDISKNPKSIPQILRYSWEFFCTKWKGKSWNFTTDVFGPMLGDVLIPERLNCKWSEQKDKLSEGTVPLPLLSAIHAKEEKNTKEFHEWVEISPYEVSIQHYGAAIDMTNFGSEFDEGLLTRRIAEMPLFEIMGICGSAYTLTHEELANKDSSYSKTGALEESVGPSRKNEEYDIECDSYQSTNSNESYFPENDDVFDEEEEKHELYQSNISEPSMEEMEDLFKRICQIHNEGGRVFEENKNGNEKKDSKADIAEENAHREQHNEISFMHSCSLEGDVEIDGAFDYPKNILMEQCMKTRRHRAAMVNNPFRNVSFDETDSFCLQGDTSSSLKNDLEKLCLIDAGLAFNSPYPLLFQPGRDVDLILSFDFTDRKKDCNSPFKTLLRAEDWARKQEIKFPKIKVDKYEGKNVQELYIFEDENDPECPIIMHFVLVNKDFRTYKKPGVRRRESEKQFVNFTIYDDQKTFHCTNFQYSEENFDRLSQLSEFIVLNNIAHIEACISKSIQNKQNRIQPGRQKHPSSPV